MSASTKTPSVRRSPTVQPRSDTPCLYIESGGIKKGSKLVSARCEVVVDARRLKNPHTPIKSKRVVDNFDGIKEWLQEEDAKAWESILQVCRSHLGRGKSVRVQCFGGQHRSFAVVEALGREFAEMGVDIEVVHQDRVKVW